MSRPILEEAQIHGAIRTKLTGFQQAIVAEVQAAIKAHAVVVVGMRQNPFPKKACRALTAGGVAHHYIEYGSYFGMWRQRLALKMWSGWPTLPMVFVKGVLVGGYEDLQKLIDSGELKTLLV